MGQDSAVSLITEQKQNHLPWTLLPHPYRLFHRENIVEVFHKLFLDAAFVYMVPVSIEEWQLSFLCELPYIKKEKKITLLVQQQQQ